MSICVKRREAPIDYTIDWGRGWIGDAGIVASRWSVDREEPGGVFAEDAGAAAGVSRATIRGGVPGARYTIRGQVELSDGRTRARSLTLQIGPTR